MSAIHRLVLADIERSRANAQLAVERLRSDREGISTVGATGQARALRVAKLLREAEAVAAGWVLVLAAALAEDGDPDVGELLNVQVIVGWRSHMGTYWCTVCVDQSVSTA